MRWLHLATVIILALAIVIFALQNLEMVSIDFLSFGVRIPLAFLVVAVYLVGMATGSSFLALIRRSVAGAGIGQLRRSA
jgi:lipopolysaccharide assembly protein A